jgi:hypothetical protein
MNSTMDIKMIIELQRVKEQTHEIRTDRHNCQWMKVHW